ncbi:MAG: YkvA family protein [Sphingorhabdus sp.]
MNWLRAIAHNIKVQAHAIWLCARDPEVGSGLRLLALFIAAYALSPIDLIPDFIPVLGLLDDALLIPLGVWLFRKIVPPEIFARHLATAEGASQRPVSRVGAIIIIVVWAVLAAWFGFWITTTSLISSP